MLCSRCRFDWCFVCYLSDARGWTFSPHSAFFGLALLRAWVGSYDLLSKPKREMACDDLQGWIRQLVRRALCGFPSGISHLHMFYKFSWPLCGADYYFCTYSSSQSTESTLLVRSCSHRSRVPAAFLQNFDLFLRPCLWRCWSLAIRHKGESDHDQFQSGAEAYLAKYSLVSQHFGALANHKAQPC